MKNLEKAIDELLLEGEVQNIAVFVGKGDSVLFEGYRSSEGRIDETTLFDMASVTKIVATTTLALQAIDKKELSPFDEVNRFFQTEKKITIENLMTHTIGIGHKSMRFPEVTYDNVADFILKIPQDIPIGTDVLYSCPGFVLLGKILEKIYGERLDAAFRTHVAKPLSLFDTTFLPDRTKSFVNANINAEEKGLVNDYNCRHLGGVAGNAGLFSNMNDMVKYARFLLCGGLPLWSKETFALARKNYTQGASESRALGYLFVDERYAQTGGLFPVGSVGHCGHTGQSVFVHPESGLFVVVLSDATKSVMQKYGVEKYAHTMNMRAAIHSAIKADLNA